MSFKEILIISLIVLILLILLIRFLYKKIKIFFRSKDLEGLDIKKIQKKWQEIEGLLKQNSEMSFKLAVIEADKLFDHVLKYKYFPGSTMGERLKVACYKYDKLKQIWFAHKIRNNLVHESSYHIHGGTAKKALKIFKQGFQELGIDL